MMATNLRELDTPAREQLRSMLTASLDIIKPKPRPRVHYAGYLASLIRRLVNRSDDARADQVQQNGCYGVHQLRVRLGGDDRIYRVIVAPADAPISVNGIPADQHFAIPLSAEG